MPIDPHLLQHVPHNFKATPMTNHADAVAALFLNTDSAPAEQAAPLPENTYEFNHSTDDSCVGVVIEGIKAHNKADALAKMVELLDSNDAEITLIAEGIPYKVRLYFYAPKPMHKAEIHLTDGEEPAIAEENDGEDIFS